MENASEHLARMEEVFHDVSAVSPGERSARLKELCGDDAVLLAEVANLLRAAERERVTSGVRRDRQQVEDAAFARRRIGPYQLQSLLGRGGTGAVYLARRADDQYEKTVAIKLIDVPLTTELFRERFRRERQILAGLDHPLIARLLDGGVSEEGSPYLVMDYVAGVPIDQFCQKSQLSITDRLSLFVKVCEAVQFAHRNLVVHRDLKPDNILVSSDGVPHLLDFGTAKLVSPEEPEVASQSTREGFISFTPQYASPEQVLGQPVTIASDIYSLGVLLFVLLTGRTPYQLADFSTEEMLRVIVNIQPVRPGAGSMPFGRIDGDLDSIVLKALRKEPADRYATVNQFAADLTAYLEGRPVLARRGSLRYRAFKFALRNRLALSAAVVLALTLVAGVAAVAWEAHAAVVSRRKAEARSSDLRTLSSSFLSELDDAIQQLPGSTPAQQLLVKRVSEHVERMAQDEPMDAPIQIDAADAYTRLANLQGNPYDQNIGNPVGALASIDHALQGLDRVKSANPNDPDLLHAYAFALRSRAEILFGLGKTPEALQFYSAARDTYVRLASGPAASSLAMSEAATAEAGMADLRGQTGANSLGDSAGALAGYKVAFLWQKRALAKDPNAIRARRAMPSNLLKLANAEAEFDLSKSIADYRLALDSLNQYPEAEKSTYAFRRLQGFIKRRFGQALFHSGEYTEANRLFDEAHEISQVFVHDDPKNARDAADLYVVDENQAECLEEMADTKTGLATEVRNRARQSALERLSEANSLAENRLKQNPNDIHIQASKAYMEGRTGMLLQWNGSNLAGEKLVAHAIADLRKLASDPAAPLVVYDFKASMLINAIPVSLRNPAEAVRAAEVLVGRTHRQKPNYLLQLARTYQAAGRTEEARSVARETMALLAPARAGVKSSTTQTELEGLIALR